MPRSVYLFFLISSLSILNSEAHFLTIPDHLQYFWESTKGDCPNVALTGELCINSLGTDKMFPSKFLKYTDDPYKRYQFDEVRLFVKLISAIKLILIFKEPLNFIVDQMVNYTESNKYLQIILLYIKNTLKENLILKKKEMSYLYVLIILI
jgi:hypothetical protein